MEVRAKKALGQHFLTDLSIAQRIADALVVPCPVEGCQQINPMPVIIGAAEYPQGLVEKMTAAGMDVDAFDALALAEQAGSAKAVNIVLMGHLSKNFDFTQEEWLQAIEQSVPAKFLELNKKAFTLGANA